MEWEILDMRSRTENGCYYISRYNGPDGQFFLARFCPNPREAGTPQYGPYGGSRLNSGLYQDIEQAKDMCRLDMLQTKEVPFSSCS